MEISHVLQIVREFVADERHVSVMSELVVVSGVFGKYQALLRDCCGLHVPWYFLALRALKHGDTDEIQILPIKRVRLHYVSFIDTTPGEKSRPAVFGQICS
jgi:hypothetical protein